MLQALLLGSGFAFASAIQPGPLQAFLLSSVLRHGWRRTLPAALSPLLSDGPIALLALTALRAMPPGALRGLRGAGGVFLLYLAWSALRQAWRDGPPAAGFRAAPRTLLQAALVNLLNPNPYLGWTFVLGPAVLAAWAVAPRSAIALVGAFYATMTASLAAFIVACGSTGWLGPAGQRALLRLSAAALAALGVWQVVVAIRG